MSIPIAIGWRSNSNGYAELTPLMDFILLDRVPITHSNYKIITDTKRKLEIFWEGQDDISTMNSKSFKGYSKHKKKIKYFLDE